ncbi:hypothetical protein TAF16_0874 [Anoxybacillus flavithermus]|uniref:Uncharacterized protein n=1 Tax=Anoxybacillus flavithermus TaxID=33934 RepID=A0A178THN0_9BACL|nr:hypothetical protein TAF16_0874 [Anoxybacillus flavithermus]
MNKNVNKCYFFKMITGKNAKKIFKKGYIMRGIKFYVRYNVKK